MNNGCQSCGMPIEDGTYCQYCADSSGQLHPFEEHFERMVQWTVSEGKAATREQAETDILAYMANMPAWRDHPKVKAAAGS